MNIVLCGMMGAGKTCVGKRLAELTKKSFVDTDELIVREHGAITEIFKNHGEEYFRGLERKTAETLANQDGLIIATGGGFVLCENNASLLKQKGKIVFLQASEETLINRLIADESRPLLQTGDLFNKIHTLLKERTPVYEKIADYTVQVDKKTIEETAEEIIKKVIEQ